MDWGMRNRMARMFPGGTDGNTVMLAVDHGYFMGPTRHLEDARATIAPLLPYADAIALTRGILRTSVPPTSTTPVVLRVSGGATVLKEDLSHETITTAMRDAARLNVSAVALSVFVGAPHEHESLVNLAKLVDEGEEAGIPVLAITAVGKELEKRDARYLALACRVSAELGAHLVKTYYCDDFEKVVEGCPVPLVVAGRPEAGQRPRRARARAQRDREGGPRDRHGPEHLAVRPSRPDAQGAPGDRPREGDGLGGDGRPRRRKGEVRRPARRAR